MYGTNTFSFSMIQNILPSRVIISMNFVELDRVSSMLLFVSVDALRSRSTAEVMSGRSVIISTLFLGKPPRGRWPVLSAHPFAINWQLLFLNQRKRKNGRRNNFMTKSSRKDVPDARIDRDASWFPSDMTTDRATCTLSGHGWVPKMADVA